MKPHQLGFSPSWGIWKRKPQTELPGTVLMKVHAHIRPHKMASTTVAISIVEVMKQSLKLLHSLVLIDFSNNIIARSHFAQRPQLNLCSYQQNCTLDWRRCPLRQICLYSFCAELKQESKINHCTHIVVLVNCMLAQLYGPRTASAHNLHRFPPLMMRTRLRNEMKWLSSDTDHLI